MILLNLNHALRYTELLSDYAGTYPQHIHWISVLLCIYKRKELTFDAEFHEDMYINIWHIKVRCSTLSWGRIRISVQCLQNWPCKRTYVDGGKKSKKIEDNVQTDCQMHGYCDFVHWQGPHPEVMDLLDPFNLQQALGHVSKVHRSGSTCQKITNLIYTCNFYGAKLYSLDLRSLKLILVAIKIASSNA